MDVVRSGRGRRLSRRGSEGEIQREKRWRDEKAKTRKTQKYKESELCVYSKCEDTVKQKNEEVD